MFLVHWSIVQVMIERLTFNQNVLNQVA